MSVVATSRPSTSPAIAHGDAHAARIGEQFARVILSQEAVNNWLYNDTSNEFGVRDLGYHVGYAIARGYRSRAVDTIRAVRTLIELDYANDSAVAEVVDASHFFIRPLRALTFACEASRPTVRAIREIGNGATNVSPALTALTIDFSAPMDSTARGFDYGPLGEANVLRVRKFRGFSAHRRTVTIDVEIMPSHRHQLVLSDRFQTADGVSLRPYLIDITKLDR